MTNTHKLSLPRAVLTAALLLLLLVLAGCEKNGKIRIYNRTSYPLKVGAMGLVNTIGADSSLTLDVTTGTSTPFNPDVGKYVDIALDGETYQIWDAFLEQYVEQTSVWVEAGKTTNVYANPNRACVKVVNQSTQWIKKIIISRGTISGTVVTSHDVYLAPGESWYKQQQPSDSTHNYFYIVGIQFENDDIITFGSSTNILHVDDEFLVTVPIQE